MPPQVGDIISELVYDKKLKSNPKHPVTEDTIACYFVEALGKEKALASNSFLVFNCFLTFLTYTHLYLQNEVEAAHIIHLARKLQEQRRSYRIITPYEGQRSFIETLMKTEGLEWGDKCFNVDSFQGMSSFALRCCVNISSQEMRMILSLYPLFGPCVWASSMTYAEQMLCLPVARKGCS